MTMSGEWHAVGIYAPTIGIVVRHAMNPAGSVHCGQGAEPGERNMEASTAVEDCESCASMLIQIDDAA